MRLLLLALFLLPLSLFAQVIPVDPVSGKIFYAEEVPVKDGPKTDLYHRAKVWLLAPGKPQKALRVDDAANGLLIGNSYSVLSIPEGNSNQAYKLWHTVKIEVEDDRYWYSISDLQLQKAQSPPAPGSKQVAARKQALEALVFPQAVPGKKSHPKPVNKVLQAKVHDSLSALIQDLKKNML